MVKSRVTNTLGRVACVLPVFSSSCSLFLEENMLQDIISIIKQNRSNKIKIQIIQTISILIQNIKNKTSLCALGDN